MKVKIEVIVPLGAGLLLLALTVLFSSIQPMHYSPERSGFVGWWIDDGRLAIWFLIMGFANFALAVIVLVGTNMVDDNYNRRGGILVTVAGLVLIMYIVTYIVLGAPVQAIVYIALAILTVLGGLVGWEKITTRRGLLVSLCSAAFHLTHVSLFWIAQPVGAVLWPVFLWPLTLAMAALAIIGSILVLREKYVPGGKLVMITGLVMSVLATIYIVTGGLALATLQIIIVVISLIGGIISLKEE